MELAIDMVYFWVRAGRQHSLSVPWFSFNPDSWKEKVIEELYHDIYVEKKNKYITFVRVMYINTWI